VEKIDIIQEKYIDDPWKILICCILLNQTTNNQVRSIVESFFEKWPNYKSVTQVEFELIRDHIRTTGFQNLKAKRIISLSSKWDPDIKDPSKLPGVGKYAMEAWRIFIDKDFNFIPTDKKLKRYLSENI
jgi:methyl-CpG-binding domain protein 4